MNERAIRTRGARLLDSVAEFWSWLTNDDFDFVEARPNAPGARPAERADAPRDAPDRRLGNALAPKPGSS